MVAAIAMIATASCIRNSEITEPVTPEGSGIMLTLDMGPMSLTTKAQPSTRPGDEDGEFNENRIQGPVLVFFFDIDANENTPARWNKPVSFSSSPLYINVAMSDLAAMFGSNTPQAGAQATVMIVANYDNEDDPFDFSNNKKYTKKEIREKTLARADWSQHPQELFPMLSDETVITLVNPSSTTPATGTVKMRRRAAKVTFLLSVADEIAVENYAYSTDLNGNVTAEKTIEIWHPLTTKMTIYSQYFMKDGTLGGVPKSVPNNKNDASLFTGVDNPYILAETDSVVTRNRTLFVKDEQGHYIKEADGSYRTTPGTLEVPVYKVLYNDGNTNPDDDIDGPFYTYPVTWTPGIETEPFLKLIIPWQSNDGRIKYYYYKIPFTVSSLEANNWYEVSLDVQILGGESELPVPLTATYHVVDWVRGAFASVKTVQARYLNVPTKEFTLYNLDSLEMYMLSSHPCAISLTSITKRNHKTNTDQTFDASILQDLEVRSLEEMFFRHRLNNTMGSNLDCAPYIIKFRVYQIDKPDDYYADITITQYPAIYIEKQEGGNAFVDGYYSLVSGGKPDQDAVSRTTSGFAHYYHYGYFSVDGGRRVTPYGNLSGVANGQQANTSYNGPVTVPTSETENTVIHVTAFAEDSYEYTYNGNKKPYIISDPRIKFMDADVITDKTLVPYLTPGGSGGETTEWTTEQLNALMVGTDVDNIIAPVFMFASEWGRQGNQTSSFQTVAKRCATYQEAGYPAGRWRLPTEAEVAFVANLQANQFIGPVFGGGSYWISNGKALQISGSSVTQVNSGNSTRCVYDIWYWGADPVVDPTYQYAVMP